MAIKLTHNAISAILGGDTNIKPLVQVLDIRSAAQNRFRLLVSDSVSASHAMLTSQMNDKVLSGEIRKGSVVQLIDYMSNCIQDRKIIVILNMETIIPDCEIIGNPKALAEPQLASQSAPSDINVGYQPRFPSNMSAPTGNSNRTVNFRPTVQPAYQPPAPNYRNHGSIVKNEAPARIIPIAALNPYQGRWAIKARVTAKGDLRRYNNARGDGKVFSFDLLDSDGGEIRVTCFNAVVDRFYDSVEVGKVYVVSKGSLKPAKRDYNHLKNEWEIFLEAASTMERCEDEDSAIPQQQFSFTPICDIENVVNNSILDVIGIVITVNPSVPIMRKNGMETQRRTLVLKDGTKRTVEITLWGEFCNKEGRELQEMFEFGLFPVLAVKAGKINDFSGKSVGTISSSQLFINPDFPEAHMLRNWFDLEGKDSAAVSISRDLGQGGQRKEIRKTVAQIKNEGLGRGDKPDWVTLKASISFIKNENFCYTACPLMIGDRQCSKKVVSTSNNRWQCERCNQEFDECDYRYLLQAQVMDNTGLTWVTAFQETGEEIMGCSAKELSQLKNEQEDDIKFTEQFRHGLYHQFLLRLKIKEESYGEEQKVKITVLKAEKVNFSAESRYLLDSISKFSA